MEKESFLKPCGACPCNTISFSVRSFLSCTQRKFLLMLPETFNNAPLTRLTSLQNFWASLSQA